MTINDIAVLAGVSKSTVSRYLTGGSVSAKSASKIAKVIEETGFVLNASASKLRSQKSGLVGVLIDGIESRAVRRELLGINVALREVGCQPFIVFDVHDQDHKLEGMQALVRQGVDGIVFGVSNLTQEHVRYMLDMGVPALVLGQQSELFPFAKVNDEAGGRLMAEHVIACGAKHVLYLGFPGYDKAGLERWQGFVNRCSTEGIGVEYLECGYRTADGYNAADRVLASAADFLVAATDKLCLGLLHALGERGLAMQEMPRMASFGNYTEASLPMVSLSSIDFDYDALGRDAGRLIYDLISGREVPHANTDYGIKLHVRQSSKGWRP